MSPNARSYTCNWCGAVSDGSSMSCPSCGATIDVSAVVTPTGWTEAPGRKDMAKIQFGKSSVQIEGLYVDTKPVSLADLKATLSHFARAMMGPGVGVRFRPHFFPFTEPSVEVDFSCHLCSGQGCRVCKQSGWIEIAGAGMVDPRVYTLVGYDPAAVYGYAFGMGVERIAMIKYGITDIRHLYENDVRFLAQFA